MCITSSIHDRHGNLRTARLLRKKRDSNFSLIQRNIDQCWFRVGKTYSEVFWKSSIVGTSCKKRNEQAASIFGEILIANQLAYRILIIQNIVSTANFYRINFQCSCTHTSIRIPRKPRFDRNSNVRIFVDECMTNRNLVRKLSKLDWKIRHGDVVHCNRPTRKCRIDS